MLEWLGMVSDSVGQFLALSPFWLQITLLAVVVVPSCAILAIILLRIVDICGALWLGISTMMRAKLNRLPDPTVVGEVKSVDG